MPARLGVVTARWEMALRVPSTARRRRSLRVSLTVAVGQFEVGVTADHCFQAFARRLSPVSRWVASTVGGRAPWRPLGSRLPDCDLDDVTNRQIDQARVISLV